MGGDLGGWTGGTSAQIWGGGTAHASVLSNILRSTVIGYKAKYEATKKSFLGGMFSFEIEAFGQEKGHIEAVIFPF